MKTLSTTISVAEPNSLNPKSWRNGLTSTLRRAFMRLEIWSERNQYRSELRRLLNIGPHVIRDIGLTWEDTQREAAKSFLRE
jgi:uncharacterized protein YjiS (DUF1127 family)